jgi:hypothetical protein
MERSAVDCVAEESRGVAQFSPPVAVGAASGTIFTMRPPP